MSNSIISNNIQYSYQNENQIKKKKKSRHFPFNLFHHHDKYDSSNYEYDEMISPLETNKSRSNEVELVNFSRKYQNHRFRHLRHGFFNYPFKHDRDPWVGGTCNAFETSDNYSSNSFFNNTGFFSSSSNDCGGSSSSYCGDSSSSSCGGFSSDCGGSSSSDCGGSSSSF